MVKLTRRNVFGAVTAAAVALFMHPVQAAREWYVTKRRVPNPLEMGRFLDITPRDLEDPTSLRRQFDQSLEDFRRSIEKRPTHNLWRFGWMHIEIRIGRADTAEEWALVRGEAQWPDQKPYETL